MDGIPGNNKWWQARHQPEFDAQLAQIEADHRVRDDMMRAAEKAACNHPDRDPCFPLFSHFRYVQVGAPGPGVDMLFSLDDEGGQQFVTFRAARLSDESHLQA